MKEYKVGDKIKVRRNLERGYRGHGKVLTTDDMALKRGKAYHIKEKWMGADGLPRYALKEDSMSRSWTSDMFEAQRHQPIIIYQKDDTTVVALDKETSAECLAICSKDDKFDFMAGADIAFDRLKLRLAEKNRNRTVQEKREWLDHYCTDKNCRTCVLGAETCRCGEGTHFLSKDDGEYGMTDAEINLAYALVKATEGK